jgi:L-ascorbate metabolism protein UlaG (beta-lactamase superfamily)
MKITHYLYNSFLIEWDDKKIAIDPGALFCYWFSFKALIPESEWKNITHIFVTHGDPDHYWHADRMADVSGAPLVMNKTMVETTKGERATGKQVKGEWMMLGPRSKGLTFDTPITNVRTLGVDETIQVDDLEVTGIKTVHGPLKMRIGPMKKTIAPGPGERIGWGAIGFRIRQNGQTIINLGDTLLQENEWANHTDADVLMIPIGGKKVDNTMDECEALRAVEIMKPRLVIPTHYNCPILFKKRYNPADDRWFQKEVEQLGSACKILPGGESTYV